MDINMTCIETAPLTEIHR